jgi:hypothetical protein
MNSHPVRFAAWTEPGLQAIWSYFSEETQKAMTVSRHRPDKVRMG